MIDENCCTAAASHTRQIEVNMKKKEILNGDK